LDIIRRHEGRFKISFSLTGVVLEQFQQFCPEVMSTFDALAQTGCVEFLAETYYHSLSFLYSRQEFIEQVNLHTQLIQKLFGQTPRVFRNTELIYNNQMAEIIESMNQFDAVITEGADHILGARNSNYVYRPVNCKHLKLLLKNYSLSDDIAFRFGNQQWNEYPLMADKFAAWVNRIQGNGQVVNLFMDYETFGKPQWQDTGIYDFLAHLPEEVLKHSENDFKTPSEVADAYDVIDTVDVPHIISWADMERDLSAWLGNAMQSNALHELYRLEKSIRHSRDQRLLEDWRKLQTSDHFYYMCTKYFADGSGRQSCNPYDSPYDSYINFMNVLNNLKSRCENVMPGIAPVSSSKP
jgi:alpha-amylase